MKKLKALLFAIVGVLTLSVAMIKVNAAGEKYGVYTVSEAGKKAEWDFTQNVPSSNVNVTTLTDDSLYGIGGDSTKGITFKSSDKKISNNTTGTIYVPMPSSDAAGTITIVGNRSGDRNVTVNGDSTKTIADNKNGASYTFTASDLATESEKVWLKLTPGTGEVKIGSITVVLTTGEYEATAAKITVTLKDVDENVLRTDATVDSGTVYDKGYVAWGFDTTGYFLDKELTQPYNNAELSEDTTLYVGLDAWDGLIENPNNLTNELVAKLNGVELGSVYPLTGTIYTLLASTSYGTTGNYSCINTGGAVSEKAEKGIQVVAETAGTLEVTLTSGGTSARNAKVVNTDTKAALTVKDGNVAWSADEAKAYEVRTLTYDVEAGTYNIGGDNGMRIISVNFIPAATIDAHIYQQEGTNAEGTTFVRYITIVNGIDEADLEYTLNIQCEDLDFTAQCVIANQLLNNGNVYEAEIDGATYTFDVKDGTLYIICVLAVKDADHQEFAGKEITATMTVNGVALDAKVHTISE
ncbi:MAG: hypothetical protein K2H02_03330 [Anaeroplasmataceae bacterium]|nr:hypothetical protein [Anaeroplasmataceae bacterium]MDE5867955.1 hypothetical protein [Anaeroplasmataceae bacterium]